MFGLRLKVFTRNPDISKFLAGSSLHTFIIVTSLRILHHLTKIMKHKLSFLYLVSLDLILP